MEFPPLVNQAVKPSWYPAQQNAGRLPGLDALVQSVHGHLQYVAGVIGDMRRCSEAYDMLRLLSIRPGNPVFVVRLQVSVFGGC